MQLPEHSKWFPVLMALALAVFLGCTEPTEDTDNAKDSHDSASHSHDDHDHSHEGDDHSDHSHDDHDGDDHAEDHSDDHAEGHDATHEDEAHGEHDADAESGDSDQSHAADDHDTAAHGEAAADFYTVAHYDLKADPAEQLKTTLQRAQQENKRVLLQVGGDWCGWCKLMTEYIDETESVNQLIADNFLIQKVTYDSKNENEAFLSKYPKISGYPHLFVLSKDGELLHSQNTGDLEEGKGYSETAFTNFLKEWKGDESEAK